MISIVMSYYNRIGLLEHTLSTFTKSEHTDFEVIVVDDFSDIAHSLTHINNKFPTLNIKVIHMSSVVASKSYANPCVPYNVGFRNATGNKIIIQNPECCHEGDVIRYVENHLTDNNCLSFHCYASTAQQLEVLRNGGKIDCSNNPISYDGGCWYNHREHRPCAYHFTTAISRSNLAELNGFDERFANGRDYDDDEFVTRIKRKGLDIQFVEDPFVIHQYHGKSIRDKKKAKVTVSNKDLFASIQHETIIRANNSCGI